MGLLDETYICSNSSCDFRIGSKKWNQITTPRSYAKIDATDNLSALNNLGHELITEDFSDSPYKSRY